jgi:hypothetical protein
MTASPPLEFEAERGAAGATAGAAHGEQDALALLVVEIGALQHLGSLLLEQLVERQVAGFDL